MKRFFWNFNNISCRNYVKAPTIFKTRLNIARIFFIDGAKKAAERCPDFQPQLFNLLLIHTNFLSLFHLSQISIFCIGTISIDTFNVWPWLAVCGHADTMRIDRKDNRSKSENWDDRSKMKLLKLRIGQSDFSSLIIQHNMMDTYLVVIIIFISLRIFSHRIIIFSYARSWIYKSRHLPFFLSQTDISRRWWKCFVFKNIWILFDATNLASFHFSSLVEFEWFSCKNLQVSCKFLQADASPFKFFFQKLAISYKLINRSRLGLNHRQFCRKINKRQFFA